MLIRLHEMLIFLVSSVLRGSDAATWSNSLTNELGRLSQGINSITGNDCLDFIHKTEVSIHKKAQMLTWYVVFVP